MFKTLLEYGMMRKMVPWCITIVALVITMRIAVPLFRNRSASYGYYANSGGVFRGKSPIEHEKQAQHRRVLMHGRRPTSGGG